MKKEDLYNVWYASEEKAKSSSKLIVYDAIGELMINYEEQSFKFTSKTITITSSEVLKVEFKHQTLNWKAYLFVSSIITSYFYLTTGSLLYPIVMLVLGGSIGILSYLSFRWVKVDFKDVNDIISTIYFADGNFKGYAGAFGGNKKLYAKFLSLLQSDTHYSIVKS